jgi:tRNA pseudouridine38-40 synthase
MRNIRLTIQYDGTDYSGWQVQKNAATIQGLLEKAVHSVTGETLRVTGAGRTDAGVHAFDQVALIKTSSRLEPDIIKNALNAQLPMDIRIIHADDIHENFHPRYDAKNKTYTYLISRPGPYSIFLRKYSWQLSWQLDPASMREAASRLKGKHDFSCFQASGCSARHPVREIMSLDVDESESVVFMGFTLDAPLIKISITANSFLRHMARNVIGTLVEAGKGRLRPDEMAEILELRDRDKAGPTAPACGLFLEKIEY